jgi:hypothetical protein
MNEDADSLSKLEMLVLATSSIGDGDDRKFDGVGCLRIKAKVVLFLELGIESC